MLIHSRVLWFVVRLLEMKSLCGKQQSFGQCSPISFFLLYLDGIFVLFTVMVISSSIGTWSCLIRGSDARQGRQPFGGRSLNGADGAEVRFRGRHCVCSNAQCHDDVTQQFSSHRLTCANGDALVKQSLPWSD